MGQNVRNTGVNLRRFRSSRIGRRRSEYRGKQCEEQEREDGFYPHGVQVYLIIKDDGIWKRDLGRERFGPFFGKNDKCAAMSSRKLLDVGLQFSGEALRSSFASFSADGCVKRR